MIIPSGKRLNNDGKSHFLMGKSTINGPCSVVILVIARGYVKTSVNLVTCLKMFEALWAEQNLRPSQTHSWLVVDLPL